MTTPSLSFEQLSKTAKEHAIEQMGNFWNECKWYDSVYEDVKQIASLMGIEIENIGFSGFWCQGDGAHFEGIFSYKKGAIAAVKAYAPLDEKLHDIVHEYASAQRKSFYKLSGSVKHSGTYSHSGCTDIDVQHSDDMYRDIGELYQEMKDVLRSFMDWIYDQLEEDYNAQTQEESAKDYYKSSETVFDEKGNILH